MTADAPLGSHSIIQRQWLIACFWVCQYLRTLTFLASNQLWVTAKLPSTREGSWQWRTSTNSHCFQYWVPERDDSCFDAWCPSLKTNVQNREKGKIPIMALSGLRKLLGQDRGGLYHHFGKGNVLQLDENQSLRCLVSGQQVQAAQSDNFTQAAFTWEKKSQWMVTVSAEQPINQP